MQLYNHKHHSTTVFEKKIIGLLVKKLYYSTRKIKKFLQN